MANDNKDCIRVTLEIPHNPITAGYLDNPEKMSQGQLMLLGYPVVGVEYSEPLESPTAKKARLLREAADLIRQGTELNSPVGSVQLRNGLLRIAEAYEVETE